MGADGARLAIDGGPRTREAPYDTRKGNALLGEAEEAAVLDVLRSRDLFRYGSRTGPSRCDAVEAALRRRLDVGHALVVSSGTAALASGLVGLGIPPGAEVIIPAVTFVACVNAVVWSRGVPVCAEVDDSLTIDPDDVEQKITDRTFAVMPVHLGNAAADMDRITAVARRHGIRVLEDAAQALGVAHRGRPVGSIGDAGALSFQVDKNVSAGEGGALVTSDDVVHHRAERFHDQGGQFTTRSGVVRGDDDAPFTGANLRMSELTAAVCDVQLGRLDPMLERLRALGDTVRQALADLPVAWRRLPDPDGAAAEPTMFLGSRLEARSVVTALVAEGIPASTMYGGQPVYATPAVRAGRTPWGIEWESMPRCRTSEQLLARSVTIGLGPTMTGADVDDVVDGVRKVVSALVTSSGDERAGS